MKATRLTRIARGFWFTLGAESLALKRRRALHLAVATLTLGLLTGCPIAVESMIQGNPTASAATLNHAPAQAPAAETRNRSVETLALVRHAEKPAEGLGLLTCKGLNRALLLPDFFAANFKRPDHIFAPNPAVKVTEIHGNGQRYDYVRPLLTISPTAVRFGVPINTQLPFNDPGLLADTLLDPQYHNDTIYVAWEHSSLVSFAEIVLTRFHDPTAVPPWSNSDYETLYVFRINWGNKVPTLKFEVRSENLGPISENCPQASKP
jgi:hypothetical protein